MSSASAPRFAPLLRSIITHELKRSFTEVAQEIGMAPRNFHSRISGRVSFTPEEINQVLRAIPDPRLVDCLLVLTPMICTSRAEPAPRDPAATLVDLAMRAVEQSIEVLRDAMHLTPPGAPVRESIGLMQEHIVEAQRQLGALQLSLPSSSGALSRVA